MVPMRKRLALIILRPLPSEVIEVESMVNEKLKEEETRRKKPGTRDGLLVDGWHLAVRGPLVHVDGGTRQGGHMDSRYG